MISSLLFTANQPPRVSSWSRGTKDCLFSRLLHLFLYPTNRGAPGLKLKPTHHWSGGGGHSSGSGRRRAAILPAMGAASRRRGDSDRRGCLASATAAAARKWRRQMVPRQSGEGTVALVWRLGPLEAAGGPTAGAGGGRPWFARRGAVAQTVARRRPSFDQKPGNGK